MLHRTGFQFSSFFVAVFWMLLCPGWAVFASDVGVDLVLVPANENEPGGPAHSFRIGQFEITNEQFIEFLNDAMNHLTDGRGQYMYFETTTGDVYVHSSSNGAMGATAPDLTTLMFSPTESDQIEFTAGHYAVKTSPFNFTDHPVSGVSWYGALKYCNWLTLRAGLDPTQRVYAESTSSNLNGWRPISISTVAWAVRDLNETERQAILQLPGFRLPMDGGADSGSPGLFNEWYKAAAWNGVTSVNQAYGFGRDTLSHADANYRCSLDPFEDGQNCLLGGTTPVGYYDGTDHAGSFFTNGNNNYFGAFDLTGNVWEWMQDQSFTPGDRRNRGGSHVSATSSLPAALATERPANSTNNSTGFRIAQSVPAPFLVSSPPDFNLSGPWGGILAPSDGTTYCVTNLTDAETQFAVYSQSPWIDISISQPNGILASNSTSSVEVSVNFQCQALLGVGTHQASILFEDLTNQIIIQRIIQLTLTEPLSLSPSGGLSATAPYHGAPVPASMTITLESDSDSPIHWSAQWVDTSDVETDVAWVTVEPASGVLTPEVSSASFIINLHSQELAAGNYTANVILTNQCTGSTYSRPVSLVVVPPFNLNTSSASSSAICDGPFAPAMHQFTLSNPSATSKQFLVSVPPAFEPYLSFSPPSGTINGNSNVNIMLTINAYGDEISGPMTDVPIQFVNQESGYVRTATLSLVNNQLIVAPNILMDFTGPLGGPFDPASFTLTLHNYGLQELTWTATFVDTTDPPPPADWLTIDEPFGTILEPGGTALIGASIPYDAKALTAGTYSGIILIATNNCSASRPVSLLVGAESFRLDMVNVSDETTQPGGPDYFFRMGRFEVTNRQYARFLNDALRNPDNGRGAFLQHLPAGPKVTLSGDATLLFDGAQSQSIVWQDNRYAVIAGRESLPVAGVTWFGALKFCNWLTLAHEMDAPDQRAYHEGPLRQDWYPVSTNSTIYMNLDLTPSQRNNLVSNVRGYRLPMDAHATAASAYSEWYKAAAWNDDTISNALYGFGRNTIANKDANFKDSCDPFEASGPTPIGFYDSLNALNPGCNNTANTGNFYAIYDLTGNMSEWMQDFGNSPADRSTRGGHFENLAQSASLNNMTRTIRPPDQALPTTGFRIAQTLTPEPPGIDVSPIRLTGFVGGPFAADEITLQIINDADYALDDLAVSTTSPWVTVEPFADSVQPPGSTKEVAVSPSMNPAVLGVSPVLGSEMALVPASDLQPGGPSYDYWIGRAEITNAKFAVFLNDARSNALGMMPDCRSAHMYFDIDSGSVYINDKEDGEQGTAAPGSILFFLLYDAMKGHVQFNGANYVVDTGFADHPVVGVSWYGAVKYCNWLTITSGLPAPLRAYDEAPSPLLSLWRPIVVDEVTWISEGMNDVLRAKHVSETLGYRLPMDGGIMHASPYGEWYKAAAWNAGAGVARQYGFGRDNLADADANFFDSMDTLLEGTTRTQFFNGSNSLYHSDSICQNEIVPLTLTASNANAYDLFDMTGNVAEWTQELGPTFAERITRGGSWRDAIDSPTLINTGRRPLQGHLTYDDVGFRVIRGTGRHASITVHDGISESTTTTSIIVDAREPILVAPRLDASFDLMFGQSPSQLMQQYAIVNQSETSMQIRASIDAAWLLAGHFDNGTNTMLLPAMESTLLHVSPAGTAANLPPGQHEAILTIDNLTTGQSIKRKLAVHVSNPVDLINLSPDPQEFDGTWGDQFVTPLGSRMYQLTNLQAQPLGFSVSSDEDWLKIDPQGALTGILQSNESRVFTASINGLASSLEVGIHAAQLTVELNSTMGPSIEWSRSQSIRLDVRDPMTINPDDERWHVGPALDENDLPSRQFQIVNNHITPIEVNISSDVPWIELDVTHAELTPGEQLNAIASITAQALDLHHGEYPARISFHTSATGVTQCRSVLLEIVESLAIDPFTDLEAAGTPGGVVSPLGKQYTLSNVSAANGTEIAWSAAIDPPGTQWVRINGNLSDSGSLISGDALTLLVSIDVQATATLPAGVHEATVSVINEGNGEIASRSIKLTLVDPIISVTETPISHAIIQPSGPAYSFRMSPFDTTNAEFVEFLNDAKQNPTNERGEYMYFDVLTGDVYVNTINVGEYGEGPAGRTTKLFSPGASGDIQFDKDVYTVVTTPVDYSQHPVTGVSWYGAIKYANWLTIDQGMLPTERCCFEDVQSNLAGWRPKTILQQNWLTRDMNDQEREALVTQYLGYRLPMDDGHNNANPAQDTADGFNEWFKGAAWNVSSNQNSNFGFGRNALTAMDANYLNSGDPFDNGSTPVGYYGGPNSTPTFPTSANANSFGMYDMTGNVYQWILGRYNLNANSINFRTIRGGSWNDNVSSSVHRTTSRTFTTPGLTDALVGFRVVRTVPAASGDLNGDDETSLVDFALGLPCLGGPNHINSLTCGPFDFDTDDDFDLRDLRNYQNEFETVP